MRRMNLYLITRKITVTTDNPAITISGYRAAVDRFSKELTGDLIVTFTRDGVTAVKRIPVTVAELTEAELEKDLGCRACDDGAGEAALF